MACEKSAHLDKSSAIPGRSGSELSDSSDGWRVWRRNTTCISTNRQARSDPICCLQKLWRGTRWTSSSLATDWQIQALNLVSSRRRIGATSPNYHGAPRSAPETLKRFPELANALQRWGAESMTRQCAGLNYQVAVEKRSEAEVAREFLQAQGLGKAVNSQHNGHFPTLERRRSFPCERRPRRRGRGGRPRAIHAVIGPAGIDPSKRRCSVLQSAAAALCF